MASAGNTVSTAAGLVGRRRVQRVGVHGVDRGVRLVGHVVEDHRSRLTHLGEATLAFRCVAGPHVAHRQRESTSQLGRNTRHRRQLKQRERGGAELGKLLGAGPPPLNDSLVASGPSNHNDPP